MINYDPVYDIFFWHGSEDDLTCEIGGSLLRVEQMDKDSWWWRVKHGDKIADESFAPTKELAKSNAQRAYKRTN